MAEPILTVEHLIKAYGETPVLDDISFAVTVSYTHLTLPTKA